MSFPKIDLNVETVVAQSKETAQGTPGASSAYRAPELHVVGEAGQLVQGSFGYTGRDGSYYYK
jgi:hypothetical protein